MTLAIAIAGASGRTGKEVLAACGDATDVQCTGALASASGRALGGDIGEVAGGNAIGVKVVSDAVQLAAFDVLIDFSAPHVLTELLDLCVDRECALLIGTTGHTPADLERLRTASEHIPILKAANMSLGVNVLLRVAAEVSRALPSDFDVELLDIHHRFKKDAPSGTALALAEAIQSARPGTDKPPISSLRTGGRAGDHSVLFSSMDETVTLSHSAHHRRVFAAGALRGARWLVGRAPGYYDMQDVLFGDRAGR